MMDLPADLRESLTDEHFTAVLRWWESLTQQQQNDLAGETDSQLEMFSQLPELDDLDPDDEFYPYFEYLTNHELRVVNFVADAQAQSAHRIVSSYLASLGSDYRHGQSGTVR